ncbi:peroxidase-related enzyme [Roseomonas stagni]|uniref:Peroxidase-related enzyme n=1 Tax=Falsiroseomonas algicola TaxID=2716930 RepID=A0A6M1LHB9_9PROT|nr:peroxidase-related enzyme [Falsiroseomonas algicola]NGM19670.1 peroxidase-related enzyme [Falsiroseomonas algicola]
MTDETNPAWIRLVPYDESEGYLRTLYDRVKGPGGKIDNVMRAHSLRPHTMEGHSALYKSVLHHTGNSMPVWFLECLAVYTSLSNRCDYSVAHHFAGLSRLLKDEARAGAIYKAFAAAQPERVFDGKELALLRYVRKLTLDPQGMVEADIAALREAGANDGEILEANQVCAYFNYSNRLLNGLGVTTAGDILGTSPPNTDSLDDWEHH